MPEKVDIAVGGGGATTLGGVAQAADVTVGEGGTTLVKRAKQQKCDTSAVDYTGIRVISGGDILPGTRCGIKCFY